MIDSLNTVFQKYNIKRDLDGKNYGEFFRENGYYVLPKSDLPVEKIAEIIDLLLEREAWRGVWEGKEEYMKYKKNFQPGAYRLGNLLNKHELFRKIITDKDILNICFQILGDDVKIGGLDMREPKKGTGQQDLHIDWIPKKKIRIYFHLYCFLY